MRMGGDAPTAMALMWTFAGVAFTFVVLRLYTRIVLVDHYAIDDQVYALAFVFLLLYVVFIQISALHGFGRLMADIGDPKEISSAILYEAIGQIFAVIGMSVAKWSLGFFLLRIARTLWQRWTIISAMGILMSASVSVVFVFMLQCSPPAYLWDRTIEGGSCNINIMGISWTFGILTVVCDFLFAILPWFCIWTLQIQKREKIILLVSLSLGFVAGACGIKRTLEAPSLARVENYLKDTVGLIVWSAAEITVTLVCIGIPVLRPLYKRLIDKLTSRGGSRGGSHGYRHQNGGGRPKKIGDISRSRPHYALHTFGGSEMPHHGRGSGGAGSAPRRSNATATVVSCGEPEASVPDESADTNRVYITTETLVTRHNRSDEDVLTQEC